MGVRILELDPLSREAADLTTQLGRRWLATRRAGTALGWIFQLDPLRHAARKRLFVARGPDREPAAFASCSPLPARSGWYLEDVVRAPDSPAGSAAALVAHALRCFQAEGAAWATLGGVPLAGGASAGPHQALRLGWLRRPLSRWYGFEGVARFKAQFGADHWESEELLTPAVALPLAAWAVTRLTLPRGLRSLR